MVPTAASRRQSLRGEDLPRTAEEKLAPLKEPQRYRHTSTNLSVPGRRAPLTVPIGIGVAGRQPGDSGLTAIRMRPSLASAPTGNAPDRRPS